MKILSLFLCFLSFSFSHPEHIAEYKYQLIDDQLTLKFVIEKAEIDHFNFDTDCSMQLMTALCLSTYLKNNSQLKINGELIELKLNNSYVEKGHLVIHLKAKIKASPIKELTIINNCFYEFNPKFKNRMILDVATFKKSYMLTNKKNSIHLK